MRTLARKALQEGAWLGLFRVIAQGVSWCITILLARILLPADYGLMEMATIFTGYILIFSEIGLGSAIVQKETVSQEELSSAFWFLMLLGGVLSLVAVLLAYPTAAVFHEDRLIPITQATAFLFLINAALIVPYRLFDREVAFKKVGVIDFCSVVISSFSMIAMASVGFGVWTFIGGHIIRQGVVLFMTYFMGSWRPMFRMRWSEVKPLMRFGLNIAGARSLNYVYSKADRFFAGRALGAEGVGFYAFALQLSSIPTDKIVSNIQRVAYSVLARTQQDRLGFVENYLNIVKLTSIITFPLFVGGACLAEDLVLCILGEKWAPVVVPFQILCIGQLFICMTAITNLVNNARGKPQWGLAFSVGNAIVMPLAFYAATQQGLNAVALPWVSLYPLLSGVLLMKTLRGIDVGWMAFLRSVGGAGMSTLCMGLGVLGLSHAQAWMEVLGDQRILLLSAKLLVGGGIYCLALGVLFEREATGKIVQYIRGRVKTRRDPG